MRGILCTLLLLVHAGLTSGAPTVHLGRTAIVGRKNFVEGLPSQEFFGGIPFAKAPTGPLRFAPPVPRTDLGVATFDASQYSLPCPQVGLAPNASEDCLSVNILRPVDTHIGSALPVYAWIFGGGFANGQPSLYNASNIVLESVLRGTPIIYASINYRVGPFGFPQGSEATARGALNLGLKDQLAGLEWIHNNIVAFGGDPSKITVAGGSAGSMSISSLFLNSPLPKFVRGAIFQSGSANTLPVLPSTRREQEWSNFVAGVPECTGAAPNATFGCLREANIDTLIQAYETASGEAQELFPFAPVMDGPGGLIPDLPSRLFAAGKFAHVPFIAGTNLDDATIFVPTSTSSDEDITSFFTFYADPLDPNPSAALQDALATLLDLYPNDLALGSPFGTGNDTFGLGSEYKRIAGMAVDVAFNGPRRAWAEAAARAGVKAFCYLFSDPQAVTVPSQGVAHGTEIDYTYGSVFQAGSPQPAAHLSQMMLDYWISFVVSLDPNDGLGTARPRWKPYSLSNPTLMQLQGGNVTAISDTYRASQISFLTSHSSPFNH